MFNVETGEDDEHPLGGDIGVQDTAPVIPMPPPPSQAPGPEAPSPISTPQPAAVPTPDVLPAPAMPGLPNVAPYQPAPIPPIPSSRAVTGAESANLGALDANAAARMKTAQDQGAIGTARATANDQAAERSQFVAEAFQQERKRIADEATKRIQERQAQANADYDAFKKFGIKDPEAGQGFATSILKAIAVGLGQYAQGINGGSNTALNIIQQANKDNIDRQKAQQEKLYRVAEKSGKDVTQAKEDRDDAFRQLDLKHAALLDSSAGMLRSELARHGIPQAQIDANKDVQAIEKEALGIREKALQDIRDSEVSLARADISAAGRKAKSAGAGGGVKSAALEEFARRAGQLPAGAQIPPDLVVLGAKAGLKTNQIATEVAKYRGAGATSQGTNDKADEQAYKTYASSHVKASDELKRRIESLKSAEAGALNPKSSYGEVISALEQGIAADAGAGVRGVSMGQLHSIIPNLVSAEGKISNVVSQNWDGTSGEEFRKAALRFIQRAQKERYAQMAERGAAVEKEMAATPYGQRTPDFAKRVRERLYPADMTGGEAEAAPSPRRAGGGKTLEIKTATDKALAATARRLKPGDPNYESAQMWLRAHGE